MTDVLKKVFGIFALIPSIALIYITVKALISSGGELEFLALAYFVVIFFVAVLMSGLSLILNKSRNFNIVTIVFLIASFGSLLVWIIHKLLIVY